MKGTLILIDGSNLYAACRALNFNVDYKKLLDSFDGDVHRAYYFTALPPAEEQSTLRPMVDFMEFNGFTVVTKVYKEFNQRDSFQCKHCGEANTSVSSKIKGNMDTEINIHALEQAEYADKTVLFSGDGDFRSLVEHLQRRHGHKVTVVSTIKTTPMMCADSLRRQADEFIDLADLRDTVARDEDIIAKRRSRFLEGK